ncbi:MAG: sigma factor-like helix-turn-helix DNA-binding protein, partial [candidate division Zixibacteria bacterium]|nr:sigma factor-like helix-turn-helix DNA-binding protein [candidate division Zixibacteria bacterium]
AKRYPLVKFYFSLREQFAKFYGREAGLEDFGELESLATWELEAIKSLRYVDVRPKRGGASQREDLLCKVHQNYCEDSQELVESDEPPGEIEERATTNELNEILKSRVLPTLSAKEVKVLECLYGLNEQPILTLGKVGEKFGVTGQRIYLIKAKALRKLRRSSLSRQLRDFL